MTNGSASIAHPAPAISAAVSPANIAAKPPATRTRLLLEGPIVPTLLRLAAPNVVVNVVLIAVTAIVDAHFVARMGAPRLWPDCRWFFP
jgi:hypothetical protein